MSISTPPPIPTPTPTTGFAQQAAKGSCICAVLIFLVVALGSRSGIKPIIDLVALLLMAVGLVSAIVGLCGIPRHGIKGILAPALVGLAVHGLLAFIFVTNFVAARARAQEAAAAGSPVQTKPYR